MEQILFTQLGLDEFLLRIRQVLREELQHYKESSVGKGVGNDRYLSRNEVASMLKITLPTLATWTQTGRLKGYRISRRIFYKESELGSGMKKIITTEEKENIIKRRAQNDRDGLSRSYIKKQLSKESKYLLKAKDIPFELINAKASNLAIKRELKNKNNDKTNSDL